MPFCQRVDGYWFLKEEARQQELWWIRQNEEGVEGPREQ